MTPLERLNLRDNGIVLFQKGFLAKEKADELLELCLHGTNQDGTPIVPWKQDMVTVGQRTVQEPRYAFTSSSLLIIFLLCSSVPWLPLSEFLSLLSHLHTFSFPVDRLTVFLGDRDGLKYTYSHKLNVSKKWHPLIAEAKALLEQAVRAELGQEVVFNVALVNLYVDGNHHVSWHSDNETDLREGSPIATLSIGEPPPLPPLLFSFSVTDSFSRSFSGTTRTFQLRHKSDSAAGAQQSIVHQRVNAGEEITEEEKALLSHKVGADPELNRTLHLGHGDLLVMAGQLQTHWRHRVPPEPEVSGSRIVFTFRCVEDGVVG